MATSLQSLSDLHNSELDVKLESIPSHHELTELQKCQEELNIQKIRVEDFKREIGRLIREQEQTFESYTKEVKELKRRWNRKEDECKSLVNKLEEIRISYEGKIEDVIKEKDEEITNLKERLFITDKDTKKQIDSLQQELGTLKSFLKREKEYQDTIKKLNSDLEKNRIERNELMSKIHLLRVRCNALEKENEMSKKKLSETKSELDKSMEVSRNFGHRLDSENDVPNNIKLGYDASEKGSTRIIKPRKAASQNKQRENNIISLDRSFNQVKNQVSDGEFMEIHTINVRQANKIKSLKIKNQELKTNLQQEQNLHSKEKERMQYQLLVKIKRLEMDVERCQEENRQLHGENKGLKNLSQIILEKRSEIEQFLLDAIQEAKSHSKKLGINETKKSLLSGNRLETVRKYSNIEEKPFEDLAWEEKEIVLRDLFAKLQKGNFKKREDLSEGDKSFTKI